LVLVIDHKGSKQQNYVTPMRDNFLCTSNLWDPSKFLLISF